MFKALFESLRFKIIILVLVISTIVFGVGFVSMVSIERLVSASNVIAHNEIPKLSAVQEILSAIVTSELYSRGVSSDADIDLSQIQEYKKLFSESMEQARLFLEALTWGSESDTFKEAKNGTLYAEWEEYVGEYVFIENPSPELAALAGEASLYLTEYEKNIHASFDALEMYSNFVAQGDLESARKARDEAFFFENKAASDNLGPINTTLEKMESLLHAEVEVKVSEIPSIITEMKVLIFGTALFGTFVILLITLVYTHFSIVRPIASLTEAVEKTSSGDFASQVESTSKDEIGRLARGFNVMANKLKSSYSELEKKVEAKTEELSVMLESLEGKNEDLEKSQMATVNLLEDLEEEKEAVEERVKQRTKELEREKSKLLQVTGNMRGGGILIDKKHKVVFTNDATYQILGIGKDVKNDDVLEYFVAFFENTPIKKHLEKCFNGNTFHVDEIDGKGGIYEIFFHHLKGKEKDDDTEGFFILFVDITDAKLLERSKSELVAVASHQLRTPLTAMRGNVEMLIDESFGPVNKEQHELLDDIDVSTIRLITMVNEMLDITKIERGNLEMVLEEVEIKEIVNSVISDLDSYAKRHEFEIVADKLQTGVLVFADKVRIRQVFQNLIDNAIKYSSHPGHLEISTSIDGGNVVVAFKDNGIGIPKNEQAKLFERFYRASNTAKAASSGSGLGLYIVRSIVKQLGGTIRFESEENMGTTFFVTLPIISTIKS